MWLICNVKGLVSRFSTAELDITDLTLESHFNQFKKWPLCKGRIKSSSRKRGVEPVFGWGPAIVPSLGVNPVRPTNHLAKGGSPQDAGHSLSAFSQTVGFYCFPKLLLISRCCSIPMVFPDKFSLYNSPSYPGTCCIHQASLKLTKICWPLSPESSD